MVKTPSKMIELGTRAPAFALPDTRPGSRDEVVSLEDLEGAPALLVMFICNHCPFVRHILDELVDLGNECVARDVAVVAINANDVDAYPDDHPDEMARVAGELGFDFPYLYDESQEVAKAYGAVCTPDFFLFDGDARLVYRGQFDDSRPGNDEPVTGRDLRAAADAVLDGEPVPEEQKPSVGCNIKWKPGNDPERG